MYIRTKSQNSNGNFFSGSNQDQRQHQRENEVARARNQAAPANQGVFPLVHASMSLADSLRFIATIDCDFPYQA